MIPYESSHMLSVFLHYTNLHVTQVKLINIKSEIIEIKISKNGASFVCFLLTKSDSVQQALVFVTVEGLCRMAILSLVLLFVDPSSKNKQKSGLARSSKEWKVPFSWSSPGPSRRFQRIKWRTLGAPSNGSTWISRPFNIKEITTISTSS